MATEITKSSSNLINNKMKPSSGIRDLKNKQSIDSKHKISTTTTSLSKTEAKGKSVVTSSKTKTTVKTREKKVYSLPGQKFDVPEEREPLRIFYESLSKQIPSSEMAEFWMMEHGLLSPERAKKAHERKQRRQKEIRMGTPIKSPPSRGESSKKAQQFSPPSRGESSKKPQPAPSRGESSKKPQPAPNRGESSNKPQPAPNRGESSKKPQPAPNRGESSKKPQPAPVSKNGGDAKPNKRAVDDSDDEDDFVLSHKRRKG